MNKTNTIFLALSLAFASGLCIAEEAAELHQQYCVACHARMTGGDGSVLYTRDQRLSNSREELHQRVIYCSQNTGASWSKEQISRVVGYLDRMHYQFPK